jgi:hypothetical protein
MRADMAYRLTFADERAYDSVKAQRFRLIDHDAAVRFRKGFFVLSLRGGDETEGFFQCAFLSCFAFVANIRRLPMQSARLLLVLAAELSAQPAGTASLFCAAEFAAYAGLCAAAPLQAIVEASSVRSCTPENAPQPDFF